MRSVGFVLLFLLLLTSACSKKLNNSYENNEESYAFFRDGTFTWSGYGGVGRGEYKIVKDSIQLIFASVTRTFEIQLNEKIPNSSPDSRVEVRAIHSNGRPFEGLIVRFAGREIEMETESDGVARFNIPNAPAADIMVVHFGNSSYARWDVDLRGYDVLIAIVVEKDPKYEKNQLVTYRFQKRIRGIVLNGKRYRAYMPLM